ncbi:MAG: amidohydrolase family protein [Candidatus Eiseniibacteriota bacterium]
MSTTTTYAGATLITMDAQRSIVEGDLRIEGGRITGVGGPFRDRPATGGVRVDCRGTYIVPGFIQTHVHLCQALFRGLAEETDLLDWLKDKIWPLEAAHDAESLGYSARIALIEAIRNGTTTMLDMGTVRHTDAIAEAASESGIRVSLGKALMDTGEGVPEHLREPTLAALTEAEALIRRWHGTSEGRISANLSPRFILSCTRDLWLGVRRLSEQYDLPVHTHINESPGEISAIERVVGTSAVSYFDALGILNERFVGAHGVWLTDLERRLLAERGARVTHCPTSNFKLASGACDVRALRDAGVVVGLGADGAPCNNRIDPFAEMKLAGLVSRYLRHSHALSAEEVVALATIEGARTLRLDDTIGSLEVGKAADFVVVEASGAAESPMSGTDPYTALVYQTTHAAVRTVVCNGQVVCDEGRVRAWDEESIVEGAEAARREVVERAGLTSLLAPAMIRAFR